MNDREEELFDKARKISSPEERGHYLYEACSNDAQLRDRIQALVEADHHPIPILNGPAVAVFPDMLAAASDSAADSVESPLLQAPHGGVLGDFTLIREIGHGGMGVVYEARQTSLKRKVAIKVLPFAAVLDQRQLQRFATEAKAAAGLHHQHIVPVYQVGCERAVHYYAMQYIEGQNVSELLQKIHGKTEEPPQRDVDPDATRVWTTATAELCEPSETVETAVVAHLVTEFSSNKHNYHCSVATLGIQAAEALEYAHEHGVLHRDIKPANLMLDHDGKLWVTDFGLARIEGDSGLTMTGDLMGTLRYMSPEQVQGNRVVIDKRTDVYSLGITLYEMLTLRPAYEATDQAELLRSISSDEPPPLRKIDPSIPVDLETIVLKAIAKDPVDRYGSARELADDLHRSLNDEPILAQRATLAHHITKWVRRNQTLAALLFSAAFIGGVVAASIVVVVKDREGNVIARSTYTDGQTVTIEPGDQPPPPRSGSQATPTIAPLPGILPQPPELPGIGHWQIVSNRPINTRLATSYRVGAIEWHPHGRFIALTSGQTLRVYEVPSFELIRIFCGHTSALTKINWSPDGTQIASASGDGTVRIWNFETGTPGAVLIGHASTVRDVDWHPDGERLASTGNDGDIRVWSSDGNVLVRWPGLSGGSRDVDWSPDGQLLASVGKDNKIRLWNDQGQAQSVIALTSAGGLGTVAWSPDGTQFLTADIFGHDVVRTWERDGTPGRVFGEMTDLRRAAWSPDGKHVASVSVDPDATKLRIWNVDGEAQAAVDIDDGSMWVAWSPDGSNVATSSGGGYRIWDTTGRIVAFLPQCLGTRAVRLSPDGQKLAANIGTGEEFHLLLCNPDGSDAQFLDDLTGYPLDFDWTPDSQALLVGGGQPSLRLCGRDGSAGLVLDEDPNWERGIRSLSVSPNGKQAVVNQEDDAGKNTLRIWNLDGTPGPICPSPADIRFRPAWSPQGDRVAANCTDSKLRIWTSDGRLESTLLTGARYPSGLIWKPDGTELACIDNDGAVQVWNSAGRQMARLREPDVGKPPFEWVIPQSERFSEGYSHGPAATIRFRDPHTGRVSLILAATSIGQVIQFSPDGRVIHGNPEVLDREFAYIIEQPTGAIEIVKPSEFQRRYFQEPP